MYDVNSLGKKIEACRKKKGITQEELATRLGITSQAVSKWENGNSYPDITIIPDLCSILDISLDDMFGKKTDLAEQNYNFPKDYKGLRFISAYNEIACYSDKDVQNSDSTSITFTDGSIAELSNSRIINKGKGEIKFYTMEKKMFSSKKNPVATSANFKFDKFENLDVSMSVGQYKVLNSTTGYTTVDVVGTPEFVDVVKVSPSGSTLVLGFENPENYNFNNSKGNKVTVMLAYDKTENLSARINGSGEIVLEMDFDKSQLNINGSGDIEAQSSAQTGIHINGSGDVDVKNAGRCEVRINGSGDVNLHNADALSVGINGSGDVDAKNCASLDVSISGSGDCHVDNLTEYLNAVIRGSGDISVDGGEIKNFDINISGSGEIDAENVTTDKAKIKIESGGSVKLGWVKYESIEHCSKQADVVIKRRGI